MKRKYMFALPGILIIFLFSGCKCSGQGTSDGSEDGIIEVDTSFPSAEACSTADIQAVPIEDASIAVLTVKGALLTGTEETGYLLYLQAGE